MTQINSQLFTLSQAIRFAVGTVSLLLDDPGIVLPVLAITPFVAFAAFTFASGSPTPAHALEAHMGRKLFWANDENQLLSLGLGLGVRTLKQAVPNL